MCPDANPSASMHRKASTMQMETLSDGLSEGRTTRRKPCLHHLRATAPSTPSTLTIERGERTVLVGPKGAGKSTLLKILADIVEFQKGERKLGHNAKIGYFSQHRADTLDASKTTTSTASNRSCLRSAATKARSSSFRTTCISSANSPTASLFPGCTCSDRTPGTQKLRSSMTTWGNDAKSNGRRNPAPALPGWRNGWSGSMRPFCAWTLLLAAA